MSGKATGMLTELRVAPLLVWAVFQESPRRVAVQVLGLAVLATTLTALGGGPFAVADLGDGLYRATMVQVFLVTYAATTVFLTAVRSEQLALAERVAEREQLLRGGILDAQVGLVILRRDAHGRTWIVQSNAKAAELLDKGGRDILRALLPKLESQQEFNHMALEQLCRDYAEANGLKLGGIAQPLRAALSGKTTSPGVFEVMEILGKHETLGRVQDVC